MEGVQDDHAYTLVPARLQGSQQQESLLASLCQRLIGRSQFFRIDLPPTAGQDIAVGGQHRSQHLDSGGQALVVQSLSQCSGFGVFRRFMPGNFAVAHARPFFIERAPYRRSPRHQTGKSVPDRCGGEVEARCPVRQPFCGQQDDPGVPNLLEGAVAAAVDGGPVQAEAPVGATLGGQLANKTLL